MKHFNITFRPDRLKISIHAGSTILEAASQAGIILNTVCGGTGVCRKCIVKIEPDEKEVLACQYQIQSDLTVTIPTESRFFEPKILSAGIDIQPVPEQKAVAGKASAGLQQLFGLAVDIGTTTVVAKLVDMTTGRILATEADLNPQTRFGDDCLSRIAYADSDEKLDRLHKVVIDCLNNLIEKLCSTASADPQRVMQACVVGNTTMNHIFLKLPVTSLGQAPYKPHSLDAHDVPAGRLGIRINPKANVHTVENIAGFVGSDITAAAVVTDIHRTEDITLLVDIGTNGEILLGNKEKLYVASCAAGPAFEGAAISCGGRAVKGAIEAVLFDGTDMDFDVIGDITPHCVCGSGLIDAVALMADFGIIDKTGRFIEPNNLRNSVFDAVLSRVIDHNEQLAFALTSTRSGSEHPLVLTQQDIRQIQLAKAAVGAGIKILKRKLGITDADIDTILLAGAFGNYIRAESALRIKLLPDVPVGRIHFVGNAAASGARMILLSKKARKLAARLARKIEYVEIANESDFQEIFAESMAF